MGTARGTQSRVGPGNVRVPIEAVHVLVHEGGNGGVALDFANRGTGTSTCTSTSRCTCTCTCRTREIGVGVGIGIGIDGSRDSAWSIRMQISTTPSSPQHSMVRIPKATASALSNPSPIVPLPPNRQWVVSPSSGHSPGNPIPGWARKRTRTQRSGTRSRTRGWEWREIMAGSPWISRTGVRVRVRVRAERGKSGSGSVSESGSKVRVIRRGVYACKYPQHCHRPNTKGAGECGGRGFFGASGR